MILHITFWKNVIYFSVIHYLSSAHSALSDTIVGHFWFIKLLRTYKVIEVPIPTYICI